MVWDSMYYYSKELFSNAKEYIEMNAKSRTLKKLGMRHLDYLMIIRVEIYY